MTILSDFRRLHPWVAATARMVQFFDCSIGAVMDGRFMIVAGTPIRMPFSARNHEVREVLEDGLLGATLS
ncbi:MAG: hypothetical protein LJE62_08465 [Silicimonas sp.]|nr:hypothetical protein [Silicimonas sp.]